MFVGHYGVAFAAKPIETRVPLWVWFIAVQWLDVVWSILVLVGIEKLHIVPGFTEANALDLYYMPYTHSLPGSIVLSHPWGYRCAVHQCKSLGNDPACRGRVFFTLAPRPCGSHPGFAALRQCGQGRLRIMATRRPEFSAGADCSRPWRLALCTHDEIRECQRAVSVLGLHNLTSDFSDLRELRSTSFFACGDGSHRASFLCGAGPVGGMGRAARDYLDIREIRALEVPPLAREVLTMKAVRAIGLDIAKSIFSSRHRTRVKIDVSERPSLRAPLAWVYFLPQADALQSPRNRLLLLTRDCRWGRQLGPGLIAIWWGADISPPSPRHDAISPH